MRPLQVAEENDADPNFEFILGWMQALPLPIGSERLLEELGIRTEEQTTPFGAKVQPEKTAKDTNAVRP
jgi:hypothetical protein